MTGLTTPRTLIRPMRPRDATTLTRIRNAPDVARWWGPATEDDLVNDPEVENLVVEEAGDVIGLVQLSEEDDPGYRHAHIDVFLSPAVHGRGLGTEVVSATARHLIAERGHHRITIDPAVDNVVAIACYEKVGFRRVGVMRQYERVPGTDEWRDSLLMDLLATDLPASPTG